MKSPMPERVSPSARPPEAGLIPVGDRLPYSADEGSS